MTNEKSKEEFIKLFETNEVPKQQESTNFLKQEEKEQSNTEKTRTIKNTDRIITIGARIFFAFFFSSLLTYQNYQVFSLVSDSIKLGTLQDLQLIFSTLVGATLLESAYIARVMVQFVFKDIDYKEIEGVIVKK
ncbi:hypothetical protein KBD45_02215 [Candidatus Dojkabacteria bacterium]|nr:hypothetical protein [Candidatus Dojkabacteria bacterium]